MTWKPEEHRCDGIRKKQLMALVQAATDSIRCLSDHLPVQSQEYYCQEAEEILRGAGMIIEEQWDKEVS
jgi:bacterioferritin-associated ferredoxin